MSLGLADKAMIGAGVASVLTLIWLWRVWRPRFYD